MRLENTDPTTPPVIDLPLYVEPGDRELLREGYRQLMHLCRGSELQRLFGQPYLRNRDDLTDAEFDTYARKWIQTIYHPVGTCAMGAGPSSVVDAQLRVYGVTGLRVIDASVMPTVVRGNTNAPTIAIAEKAADLIEGHRVEDRRIAPVEFAIST